MKNKVLQVLILLCVFPVVVRPQNNTSSLYSLYGLGEMAPIGTGPSMGMGGTGIGFRSSDYLNSTNPAGNHFLGQQRVLMDMGMFYQHTRARNSELTQNSQDFNISHFTISTSVSPWWRLSAGFKPFSNIGYDITIDQTIEGLSDNYQAKYTGRGGLSQLYLSHSVNIGKGLSLGATTSFVWGEVGRTEQLNLLNDFSTSILTESDHFLAGLHIDFGLQYELWRKDEKDLTLGLVFDPRNRISGVYSSFTFETGAAGPGSFISAEVDQIDELIFPASLGIGISYGKLDQFRLGMDVHHQRWANASLWEDSQVLTNSTRYAIGGEFSPGTDRFKKGVTYRAGAFFNNSYLRLNGRDINEYGVSAGIGIPIQGINAFNFSYEWIRRGLTERGLVQEHMHRISINWLLSDIWYVKRKTN